MNYRKLNSEGMTLPEVVLSVFMLAAFTGIAVMVTEYTATIDSIIEILSEPGIDKSFIANLKCTYTPSLEWNIPSIDTKAIPKSYKICIKSTALPESNYSKLANAEGKPGIYIIYSKPENGVSVNSTPVRSIFCRPKPFCKL